MRFFAPFLDSSEVHEPAAAAIRSCLEAQQKRAKGGGRVGGAVGKEKVFSLFVFFGCFWYGF